MRDNRVSYVFDGVSAWLLVLRSVLVYSADGDSAAR